MILGKLLVDAPEWLPLFTVSDMEGQNVPREV